MSGMGGVVHAGEAGRTPGGSKGGREREVLKMSFRLVLDAATTMLASTGPTQAVRAKESWVGMRINIRRTGPKRG